MSDKEIVKKAEEFLDQLRDLDNEANFIDGVRFALDKRKENPIEAWHKIADKPDANCEYLVKVSGGSYEVAYWDGTKFNLALEHLQERGVEFDLLQWREFSK